MKIEQTHILLLVEEIMGETYDSWVKVYETRDHYFLKKDGRHRSSLVRLTPEEIGKMKDDTDRFLNPQPKQKMLMVDPPEGWRYGFPKLMPQSIIDRKSITLWLVNNGYPNNLIQDYGSSFHLTITEVD